MSVHLVIIDALNLIRRIHAVQGDAGTVMQTQKLCQQSLRQIIGHTQPTHIIAVFDNSNPDRGWRGQLLPAYKANREPMPEALQQGLSTIQDSWFEMGIDSVEPDDDEADDLIATLAEKMAKNKKNVTIISTDKGYCQLLKPEIKIRDYFQQRWLDLDFVHQNFGVEPEQLTDYWALTGINSSQITGIPGIGPKTAKALFSQYKTLEEILAARDIAPKWQKKITGNEELARVCQQIVTLKTDIPLGFNLQDLRFKK
jgi:protein Xni